MIRFLLLVAPILILGTATAAEWPADFPHEGECAVCVRRGGEHGVERFVDWREHQGRHYGFCSEGCADAFDQMPLGYVERELPRPAPEFRWSTLDGSEIRPTGQRALLIDFWATWCAPCLESVPALERLARDFADHGLTVVGVSIDEKRKVLDSYLKRDPLGYPVVHDGGDDPAWWRFSVPAIPAAFLLNEQGEIVAQWSGKLDVEAARAVIEGLVAED